MARIDAAPYAADIPGYVASGRFQLIYRAIPLVYPTAIELAGQTLELSLEYDARRQPYVTARIVLGWPAESQLRYFDPDTVDLRVAIRAGYRRQDTGIEDVAELARLRVRSVELDHTARTVTLDAASDESLLISQAALTARSYTTASTYDGAIQQLVGDAFPGEVLTWSVTAPSRTFAASDQVYIGDNLGDVLEEYADQLKADLRHDGLGTWQLAVPPSIPGRTDAVLSAGKKGTVTRARVTHDRAQALTDVVVRWSYQASGTGVTTLGYALASTGRTPRSVAVVERKRKPTSPETVALRLLQRGLRRGHAWQLEALPMLWLRPLDTVTVQLPGASQVRALVRRVRFDLDRGAMTVEAHAPTKDTHNQITVTGAASYATP